MNTLSNYQITHETQRIRTEGNKTRKIIRELVSGSLFLGVLAITPGAQASDPPSIEKACLFFNKVVFHLTTDLTTSSGRVLKANDTREVIIQGNYKTPSTLPTNVTQALFTALCGSDLNNCIHNRDNTLIDSVEFSADCDDGAIKKLTGSTTP
jgi:hypothetical protein